MAVVRRSTEDRVGRRRATAENGIGVRAGVADLALDIRLPEGAPESCCGPCLLDVVRERRLVPPNGLEVASNAPMGRARPNVYRRDVGCKQKLFDGLIAHRLAVSVQGQGVVSQTLLHQLLVLEPLHERLLRLRFLVIALHAFQQGDNQR